MPQGKMRGRSLGRPHESPNMQEKTKRVELGTAPKISRGMIGCKRRTQSIQANRKGAKKWLHLDDRKRIEVTSGEERKA